MRYQDLCDFLDQHENLRELKRIAVEVEPLPVLREVGDCWLT